MAETVTRLGVVIFPGFALLDVAGPMQFFNQLSSMRPFQLSLIAKTMEPVSTIPPEHIAKKSPFHPIGEVWLPTHTYETVPELDVLLIPGGLGANDETIFNDVAAFVKKQYPTLKYLLSVCTGSTMIAGAGLLDGRRATSNKFAWSLALRNPAVRWVPKARWVVDGNIWSSSGVAAGMDMTYAFISTIFSPDLASQIANVMEYEPHTNPEWDPFSDIWHVPAE
jgi:transcriptional regulator GlxA family with amidase domain